MEICCSGTARISHVLSGEIFGIEADELVWDIVGGDERQMGPETHFEASVEHPDLGTLNKLSVATQVAPTNFTKASLQKLAAFPTRA